ncbi:hypothetical protein BZG36_03669 [Bifiguratus adelaidae]|uniref:Aldehyde dehydrogenase n=1 Tax=Bifiguratus adelaidae TaxID=1938954 RepID=A0A261XZR8_9FUNG|nr:hypothetical protein BZG36_03669 [Bifiguratus adelaidae]
MEHLSALKKSFRSGLTRSLAFRREQIRAIQRAITENVDRITAASRADLGHDMGPFTCGVIEDECSYALAHLEAWMTVQEAVDGPYKKQVRQEPFGAVLIISPWNAALVLAFQPLVGVIAAGNVALIKPSEWAPHGSRLIKELVQEYLDPRVVRVEEGDVETSKGLLSLDRWDFIVFTGGNETGRQDKTVMIKAAERLTPVLLELGGKSPTVVLDSANIQESAKAIARGKLTGSGQVCVSPDYIVCSPKIQSELQQALEQELLEGVKVKDGLSENPLVSHIVHERAFHRLKGMADRIIERGKGGFVGDLKPNQATLFLPPLVSRAQVGDEILESEIFGPFLPILTLPDVDAIVDYINSRDTPLALYVFGALEDAEDVVSRVPSGGCGVNDVLTTIGDARMPLGGLGASGVGAYRGKFSFEQFTHPRLVIVKNLSLSSSSV